jgi:hypothetical protein
MTAIMIMATIAFGILCHKYFAHKRLIQSLAELYPSRTPRRWGKEERNHGSMCGGTFELFILTENHILSKTQIESLQKAQQLKG